MLRRLRRRVAVTVVGIAVASVAVAVNAPAPAYASTGYATALANWAWMLDGGPYPMSDPNAAAETATVTSTASNYESTMNLSPGRTYLWSDLSDMATNEEDLGFTYERVEAQQCQSCLGFR